ncbi:MAG: amidohydrolase [Gammaproteobacteria bacterium]|nr:amidohydrolase [Gammaproteobacteria bacterium]
MHSSAALLSVFSNIARSASIKISAAILLALWSVASSAAVTIVGNGEIYSVAPQQPKIEAFAFDEDKFVATGSLVELRQQFAGAAEIDLEGATVVPGFIDAHGHLLGLGQSLMRVDLVGSEDKAEILRRLESFAADLPPDQWLLGRGWDQNDWPVKKLPTASDLDAAFPTRPVWLERIDGHAGWGNSAAMKFAKQKLAGSWQPEGGEIVRDKDGLPTGIFIDNAAQLIDQAVPPETPAQLQEALTRAMAMTASVGLTSMHDAGTSKQVWEILQSMKSRNEIAIRVYAMADGNNSMLNMLCEDGAVMDPEALLTARAVKLYSDGALGSRGAAMLAPYSDSPDQLGLLIVTPENLGKTALRATQCGLQVNIHAIGDRGNRVSLDALTAATKMANPGRHRIEHSQVIAAQDFPRFKSLNLIASVQPTHATSDMYWAEDRVGAERIKGAYAWQRLIESGVPLALGSDFPVEKPDPLLGFYAAVSRQDSNGWPAGGWYAQQRLSREQALYGFTMGAAFAAFQEQLLGSIEAGKKADFVVLSDDLMTVPVEQILQIKILNTYMNGKAIYNRE